MQETDASKEEDLIIQRGAEQLADIIEQWIWYRESQKKSQPSTPLAHPESENKELISDEHRRHQNQSNS